MQAKYLIFWKTKSVSFFCAPEFILIINFQGQRSCEQIVVVIVVNMWIDFINAIRKHHNHFSLERYIHIDWSKNWTFWNYWKLLGKWLEKCSEKRIWFGFFGHNPAPVERISLEKLAEIRVFLFEKIQFDLWMKNFFNRNLNWFYDIFFSYEKLIEWLHDFGLQVQRFPSILKSVHNQRFIAQNQWLQF